jgi:hypothetical protein
VILQTSQIITIKFEDTKETLKSIDIREDEIKWVLTVPAIWSDQAKDFMRKSAEKVYINKSLSRMSSLLLSI